MRYKIGDILFCLSVPFIGWYALSQIDKNPNKSVLILILLFGAIIIFAAFPFYIKNDKK